MDELIIHPHAYKHGLSKEEIESAWNNKIEALFRRDGRYLALGVSDSGKIVEMIASMRSVGVYVLFHAIAPPTKNSQKELNIRVRTWNRR